MRAKGKKTFESYQTDSAQMSNELESDIAMVMNFESLAIKVMWVHFFLESIFTD